MDTSGSMDSANDSGEDSDSNENNAASCRDEILMPFVEMDDEEEEDDDDGENFEDEEDSDNNDNEKDGEDLLLALGEGCSEERNNLPDASDNINVSSSKFNLQFLQKSQDSSTGLTGGLDILNLNELSKLVAPGTSKNANINESTCLFLNNIYQTLLVENLTKVRQKLAENQEKQKVLIEKIQQTNKSDHNRPRKNVFCMPYFHRKGNEPAPNAHTKILQTWHTDRIVREKPWTHRDHENLLEAVHENAWELSLKPFLHRLEIYSSKIATLEDEEERKINEQKIEDTQLEMEIVQQKDMDEIIDGIDDDKIDWMKISNLTFNGKHSEFSCHLMWKNWLHPRLNKSPWTQKETKKLKDLVAIHGRHQWQFIAKELETNRTPFHCLQHYRRKLDSHVKREWTEEEDKILKEVIEMCRIGEHVPWNQVSFYMEGRSSDACSKRWGLLDPSITRGRWTTEEDSMLIAGVNMLGTNNWFRIKQLVAGRTASQCRERWINCLDPNLKTEPFTYDEDKLLLKYVMEHGYNWADAANMLSGRTDAACRRQYDRLKKWEKQSKYVSKQSDESKHFFINEFDVKKYADLVEAKKSTLDELFPLHPCKRGGELVRKIRPQMLKRDLVRQELDRRKGEIVVPRPPNLRNYSNHTLMKLWENRKNLQKNIEKFIQKQMIKNMDKSPKKRIKGYTEVSSKLDKLKPNTSVTEMLAIARCISIGDQSEADKSALNKRRLCAEVDKKIRSLLYLDWLKEDMKNKPKLVSNKSKASCQEEKILDRLEGMTLLMTVLGMDQENFKKKESLVPSSGALRSTSINAEELQNLREEFRLIAKNPQHKVNFAGNRRPKNQFSDTVPPNIHTLTAFRLLFQDIPNLKKSADLYQGTQKKNNASSDESDQSITLPQKMETVKKSVFYQMLRVHFRSVFMWPALLSTLSVPRRLDVSRPYSKRKAKKSKYPLTLRKRKRHYLRNLPSDSNNVKKEKQIPKPSEESNNSETTASLATAPEDQLPRRRGRPHGAVTKNKKVWDAVPQRASTRQRGKKARFDPDLLTSEQSETKSKQTRNKQTLSSSTDSQCPATTEVGPQASTETKDLLANVSPNLVQQVISATTEVGPQTSTETKDLLANVSADLVQQVISQEVQVKQVGTYISVPIPDKNHDTPMSAD